MSPFIPASPKKWYLLFLVLFDSWVVVIYLRHLQLLRKCQETPLIQDSARTSWVPPGKAEKKRKGGSKERLKRRKTWRERGEGR